MRSCSTRIRRPLNSWDVRGFRRTTGGVSAPSSRLAAPTGRGIGRSPSARPAPAVSPSPDQGVDLPQVVGHEPRPPLHGVAHNWCVSIGGRTSQIPQVVQQGVRSFPQKAFPNKDYGPTQSRKLRLVNRIASHIAVAFTIPKLAVRCWSTLSFSTTMPMPEAAMHQYGHAVASKHQVGSSRQASNVETVAKSSGPHSLANMQLRHSPAISHSGH